jgi:hypothetical protein
MAWANCTSASLLGDLLLRNWAEKDERKETERTLKRFAQDKGWEKLQGWVYMAKEYSRFAEGELVVSALGKWTLFLPFLQAYKVGLSVFISSR